jgi:hypothetical protein
MANTATASTRKRPTRKNARGTPARQQPATNGRGKALYHVFNEDEDGTLKILGKYEGRNASEAIEAYIEDMREQHGTYDAQGITFVVVPNRNLARVTADIQTKTKVKLSAA